MVVVGEIRVVGCAAGNITRLRRTRGTLARMTARRDVDGSGGLGPLGEQLGSQAGGGLVRIAPVVRGG